MTRIGLLALAFALGCGDKDDVSPTDDTASDADADTDADTDTDTDTDVAPQSDAEGYINTNDGTLEGTADIAKAFSFYSGDAIFVYASSNPDATCALIEQLYDPENKDPVDPTDLTVADMCNLTFSTVGGPPTSYDLQDDTQTGGVVNALCTYGDGPWEYQGSGDAGYYWNGDVYQAGAWKGTFDITVDDPATRLLKLDIDIREFEGTFPSSTDRPGQHKARAKIVGTIYATECEGIEKLGIF